jgi:hypothetical protein
MTYTPDAPHEQAAVPEDVGAVAQGSFTARHPFVVYTTLRFGLLVVAGAVCYLLGARGIVLILGAFIASAIVSFIVLAPQRDAVGQHTGSYFRRLNDRIEASKSAEDELVDEYAERQQEHLKVDASELKSESSGSVDEATRSSDSPR